MARKVNYENAVYNVIEKLRPTRAIPNPKTRGKTSTGNMAFNALKYYRAGNTIYVYIDDNIAPYVPYTNEPWISPQWNGKKNPNEGWFDRFAHKLAQNIANRVHGEIEEE